MFALSMYNHARIGLFVLFHSSFRLGLMPLATVRAHVGFAPFSRFFNQLDIDVFVFYLSDSAIPMRIGGATPIDRTLLSLGISSLEAVMIAPNSGASDSTPPPHSLSRPNLF